MRGNKKPRSIFNSDEAVRTRLFEHAAKLNLRINQRIEHAAEHLANCKANGVLGSLDGTDNDITTIRVLMQFVRDHLPHTTE